MGSSRRPAGTVVGAMSAPTEAPSSSTEAPEKDDPNADRSSLRSLDRRTIVLAVVVALVAALFAGAVAAKVLTDRSTSGSESSGTLSLVDEGDLDVAALRKVPLVGSDGQATTLAAILRSEGRDGPALVNLWQSTCAPCVAEMPLLDEAATRHPDLTVVGIDPQESAAKAEEFATKTGISYPWALDPEAEFFNAALAPGLPTTLLLDAEGRFVASHTGAFTSAAELDEFLGQAS